MAKMGKYCKAYHIDRFREFAGWTEKTENLRKEKQQVDGQEVTAPRQLTENSYLYLQENYTVTDDIFLDEYIIFDNVTPEWIDFCKNTLKFEIPVYEPVKTPEGQGTAANT